MSRRLKVSDNGRLLIYDDGRPFFYLGDTAWELFHRLDREQAERYLRHRAENGYTVIQVVVLAELDGLHTPNPYGHTPLHDDDPGKPNEAYFAHVDWVVDRIEQLGMWVGMLPTWGDKWYPKIGAGPVVFTPENAGTYGRWLGKRYRDKPIIWVLGGDRPVDDDEQLRIVRAMAEGLRDGDGGCHLCTFHPRGGNSSARHVHRESWLDFNMLQSGHGAGRDTPTWDMIAADCALDPVKPTLDGEPNYEDHPVNPWPTWDPANGYFRDHDVRKQLYRSVFAGGCGVTYGHHFVWQMYDKGREPCNNGDELFPWHEAIDRPGARQAQHLRALMESRPFTSRIRDNSLVTSPLGEGAEHIEATRDEHGSYAFVYLPAGGQVSVNMATIGGDTASVHWFDPRTGNAAAAGEQPAQGTQTFEAPADGPDWVLVLDDASRGFGAPGRPTDG
ncbi:MAG: DUF4038 domain-containing protein [Chitinivibrionales bacterium]|nr:DUF4038 domain-containing protein [Chitinivibrionales bacterium]